MKSRRFSTLVVTIAALCQVLSGCRSDSAAEFAPIGRDDRLVLYEGLPHQFYEDEALAKELKTKETVQLHGFPFYHEPLDLKDGDGEKLKDLLGRSWTYQSKPEGISVAPTCGGFHPDYAVEWSHMDRLYRILICFGCHEVRVYGPQGTRFYDIRSGAYGRLEKLLGPYRKNRPPHENWGP
jgi:hypothetical protein